ncbi:efflux RND transporter periplasmic adaptor subunit [Henriciella litoralis]|uniref:efflux RND transporter periplasmic adaptor subunit n=1 Tax=Henriciella litoralis TaxID=568102 RepID=UPI000A031CA9|nr:efflux RND transporter periplasmic adaptor subunit [Henriciella litoralis]
MTDVKIALALISGLLVLSSCGSEEQTAPAARTERAVQIIPHQVSYRTETTRIEAVGTARARSSATIYPETAGEVVEVNFEAGDKVTKGDVLLRLESDAERLAERQAQVTLKNAERVIERYNKVSTPGVISTNEMDRAQAAYDAAGIDLSIARDALSNRVVRAPFSGYVGLTDIDPGARINTNTVITRIDDREILYVDFPVPEQTFGRIKPGDAFDVFPFSNPQASYSAKVMTVDSSIDATTRAYTVRTSIDNSEDNLRPGMSFRIGFDLPGQSYPSVPEASIVWGGDGAFVWAVEDGRAKRVGVTIVSRDDGKVLVKADIAEGSWVIDEGVQKVREGVPVATPGRSDLSAPAATATGPRPGGNAAAQP